jgi:hypothetical protein
MSKKTNKPSRKTNKKTVTEAIKDRVRKLIRRGFTSSGVLVSVPGVSLGTVTAIKAHVTRADAMRANAKQGAKQSVKKPAKGRRAIISDTTVNQVWDAAMTRFARTVAVDNARSQAARKAWRTRRAAQSRF